MGSGEVEKQISPLRFASVEMTIRGVQEEGITQGLKPRFMTALRGPGLKPWGT